MMAAKPTASRATERVAVLMTPAEKAAYAQRASDLGMSLGQFFREAGSAYGGQALQAEDDALSAALTQLELSTSRAERALDSAIAEVRAALRGQS